MTKLEEKNRMTKLEEQIVRYAKAYYQGEVLISDKTFDKLVEQLTIEQPNSSLLTTVGRGGAEEAKTPLAKVAHKYDKVEGLRKIHSLQELKKAKFFKFWMKLTEASILLEKLDNY